MEAWVWSLLHDSGIQSTVIVPIALSPTFIASFKPIYRRMYILLRGSKPEEVSISSVPVFWKHVQFIMSDA